MILVIILIFALTAYATPGGVLGSPSEVYDLLVKAASTHPVEGNAEGSYLTMRSREGAIFFVINLVGNFGTVFMDNGKDFQLLNLHRCRPVLTPNRILQQSYRGASRRCAPGLYHGWACLVCDPVALRDNDGSQCLVS